MSNDPFAPIAGKPAAPAGEKQPAWLPVLPVPPNAPPPPATHYRSGKPTAVWRYADATGAALGYVYRFDEGAEKDFRPLTFCRPVNGSAPAQWRWQSWPPKRPLYGLHALAQRPAAPVVVCEGEKAADAAGKLLPTMVAVTSPNGSKSAAKADWTPLRGRHVTIWADADVAGLEYAHTVAKLAMAAGALGATITSPPEGCKVGWDAADALNDGWDQARAEALISAALPPHKLGAETGASSGSGDSGKKRGPPQRDILIGLTEFCELWHDAGREAFATFPVNAHKESWPIRSREFKRWLAGLYYRETGNAIPGQALEDGLRILDARAVNDGPEYATFLRSGHHDGALYFDLCDDRWRAIEIGRHSWQIVDKVPIKLLRSPAMRALPDPEGGELIEQLRRFVNVRSDADFTLLVAWLIAAMRPRGPFPILVVNGEQGTGKSFFCRLLRALVDPSAAPIRAVPKDDRDLIVSAANSWVLAFDNLSHVAHWLSDALCRLATGGGYATRMLHTDRAEMIFEAQRPIVLNGITLLTERADLADRAVTVHLGAIAEEQRRPEDELWAEFEKARPQIIGALLDAVSAALRNVESVRLKRSPRMADFVKFVTAAEPGLGWEPGAFLAAYHENRRDLAEAAFEADAVAVAIRSLVVEAHPNGYEGTPTELLTALNARVEEGVLKSLRKGKLWPLTPQAMGNRIDRIAPLLRARGFVVERRHSTVRTIIIVPPRPQPL